MAGSDQSVNLTGMLSQIGKTLGDGYQINGKSAGEALGDNVRQAFAPTLDASDPESIDAYLEWGQRNGKITPAQATQYGWMRQKAVEKQDKLKSEGLVRDLSNRQQASTNLASRLEQAQYSGDPTLISNVKEAKSIVDADLKRLAEAVAADPVAAKLQDDADRMAFSQWSRQDQMEAAALEEADRVEQERFDKMANGFTAAFITGELDPNNEKHQQVIEQLKLNEPEVYEQVIERSSKLLKNQAAMAEDTGKLNVEMLPESYFEGLGDGAYDRYKEAHSVAPKSANTNAINQRKQIDVQAAKDGKDKDDDTYKWTQTAESGAQRRVRGILTSIASGQSQETEEHWYGDKQVDGAFENWVKKLGKRNQGRDLNDLASLVVARLVDAGVKPTREHLMQALQLELSDRGAPGFDGVNWDAGGVPTTTSNTNSNTDDDDTDDDAPKTADSYL